MKKSKGKRLYCPDCGRWTWTRIDDKISEPRDCAHVPLVSKLCERCWQKENKRI